MWDSFWDFIWYTIVIFAFVAYLIILWHIITDLFRDKKASLAEGRLGCLPDHLPLPHRHRVPAGEGQGGDGRASA